MFMTPDFFSVILRYYVCSTWFQSKMKCKSGKHFSATEKKCLDPCEAACDATLVCTTTSEPETSTEPAAPTTTAAPVSSDAPDANATSPTITEAEGSGATTAAGTANNTSDAPTKAAAAVTDESEDDGALGEKTPASSSPTTKGTTVPVDVDSTIVIDTTVPAEDTMPPIPDTTGVAKAVTQEGSTETSTAFWQTIAKHFNQPPSTIPGFTGSVSE